MNDRNIIIYLFLGTGLIFLILGIFYKKWNLYNILKPRRVIGKLFREILGENGTQNYILLLSLVFLSIGFYITYNVHIKPNLPNRYSKKTTNITLSKNGGKETMWVTIKNAEKYTNLNFDKVSLKNNFIDSIPDFIWKIETLTTLDLENNDIKKIPLERLKKSKIKKIILTGNPISIDEIKKIEMLDIEVIKIEKKNPNN